ncbi:MAG: hypothetical protein PHU25_08755 [Deltaproteobacteria bacterium]|nr:hypothetical protein [Deltaproteobacteria bacterium]
MVETPKTAVIVNDKEIEVQIGDKKLSWMKCPLGMTWDGKSCEGRATRMLWDEAKKSCPPGYRMPTHEEMLVIMGPCVEKPEMAVINEEKRCKKCKESEICNQLFFYHTWAKEEEYESGYTCKDINKDGNGNWWFDVYEGIIAVGPMNTSSMVRCLKEVGK